MEPLDLTKEPPRSCYVELGGLLVLARTIDKMRAQLPGGNPGEYFINNQMLGVSGYLLQRLDIDEHALREAVRHAADEQEVVDWVRSRTDTSQYPAINDTLRRIKPKHAQNPAFFAELYAETLAQNPDLIFTLDVIEADDRRVFKRL